MKNEPTLDSTATPPGRRAGAAAIIAILVAAALMRGVILFTGQRWLRSDESVVGLMAKHVFSRGERFLFLYGQPYGGGHAMEAYLAAPFFKLFGPSALLLTAIPALVSLVSILLLWLICRRLFGTRIAAGAAALYAFAPPVVYQSFLVNGGAESFCLSLLALLFFVRAYYDDAGLRTRAAQSLPVRNGLLVGLFSGLAYYAMDYGLLYPVAFTALLAVAPREGRGRYFLAMAAGFVVGCLPLVLFNLMNHFAHLREMMGSGGASVGLVPHVGSALGGIFSGDLAVFVGGEVDDFIPVAWPMWVAAWLVIGLVALLIIRNRSWFAGAFNSPRRCPAPGPEMLPIFFILIYLAIYLVAKFSLPDARTPRYFQPFAPFFAMAAATVLLGASRKAWATAGAALLGVLVCLGGARSLDVGTRTWHEEHRIRCSGPEMDRLVDFVRREKIRTAFAPYEIQWPLMFGTNEEIVVSSLGISPLARYPAYDAEVMRAVEAGKPFAFILRRDFAFEEWAARGGMGWLTRDLFMKCCRATGVDERGTGVGEEFVVYWPLDKKFLTTLHGLMQREIRAHALRREDPKPL